MSRDIVDKFYTALAERDGETMAGCYHQDVRFEDPAFGELRGTDAGDMWRMLTGNSTDLSVTYSIDEASDQSARASWVATYTFTPTGRAVRNEISAAMRFRDGLIVEHRDSFNLWKWSSQALGISGALLGWTPIIRSKVQTTARKNLARYQERQKGAQ